MPNVTLKQIGREVRHLRRLARKSARQNQPGAVIEFMDPEIVLVNHQDPNGAGLQLTIVYRLTDSHNGLTVEGAATCALL